MFIVKNIFTIISNVKKESQRRDRKLSLTTTKQLYERRWFMQILYVILKMLQHIVFLCFMYNALV